MLHPSLSLLIKKGTMPLRFPLAYNPARVFAAPCCDVSLRASLACLSDRAAPVTINPPLQIIRFAPGAAVELAVAWLVEQRSKPLCRVEVGSVVFFATFPVDNPVYKCSVSVCHAITFFTFFMSAVCAA